MARAGAWRDATWAPRRRGGLNYLSIHESSMWRPQAARGIIWRTVHRRESSEAREKRRASCIAIRQRRGDACSVSLCGRKAEGWRVLDPCDDRLRKVHMALHREEREARAEGRSADPSAYASRAAAVVVRGKGAYRAL